jgi:pilus assembly protein CpaB
MRAVFGLVLVVGLGLAGFAVYMVKDHFGAQQALIDQTNARAAAAVPTVDVYAVNRSIEYGEPLTLDDLVVIKYAKDFLPEGTFMKEEDLFPEGPEVLRVVTHGMALHEPILASKVTAPGQNAGITSSLANGMRAFTINVDATTGVSGFLRPGDRVDVYWTGSIATGALERQGRQITRLIKSSLQLIAVDQSSDETRNSAEVAKTVTVQVSPQDVASLAQAQSTGNLSLSLVGNNDETIATAIEVDQRSLLGIEDAPVIAEAPQPEPEQICTIRQRRGAEVVETPIPCTN